MTDTKDDRREGNWPSHSVPHGSKNLPAAAVKRVDIPKPDGVQKTWRALRSRSTD